MQHTGFLCVAIGQHRDVLLNLLADDNYQNAEFVELPVSGVPGVARVVALAWPDPPHQLPDRIGVDVVQVGDVILETPISFFFGVGAHGSDEGLVVHAEEALAVDWPGEAEVESVEASQAVQWLPVVSGQRRQEVRKLDLQGRPVFGEVDTTTHSFRMTCKCGRERFARANSRHQVRMCHVCQRLDRRRRRAVSQFKRRQRGRPHRGRVKKPLMFPDVSVGQIWEDRDRRFDATRQIEIIAVKGDHIVARNTQSGRRTEIHVNRFKEGTNSGYGYAFIQFG